MSNYLKLAREARETNNTEDAKKFYDLARAEDPDCIEARYFYAVYNVEDAINRDVPNKFTDYINTANVIVPKLAAAALTDEEKIDLVSTIAKKHVSLCKTITNHIYRNSMGEAAIYSTTQRSSAFTQAYNSYEIVGNSIAKAFGGNPEADKAAVVCWKGIIGTTQNSSRYFYTSVSGDKEASKKKWEEMVKKIKAVDPNFEVKEPKAFTCGIK